MIYSFDVFQLDERKRLLRRDGQLVPLPSKAFDLLLTLIHSGGREITKEELMQTIWADQIVEDANLTVTMSHLRKALGEKAGEHRFIVTIPGRGYRFIPELQAGEAVIVEQHTVSEIVIEDAPADTIEATCETKTLAPVRTLITDSRRFANPSRRITAAVIVVMLVGLTALGLYWWSKRVATPAEGSTAAPAIQIKSIAVLPFKPLVSDNRDESLEMGMADTLIAKLSNITELSIRPISSVRKYAGLDQDAVAAGREQKVDAVLDGQIQKAADKIRVTVRLVRVADGAPIWTSQFDENVTGIFAVQDSISSRVAETVAARLTGEEKKQVNKQYTANADAYQIYLKGRYHLQRLTDDGIRKSVEYFHLSIEKDPNFALAYAGLANSYNALGDFNVMRPNEVYPKARSAAQMALKLDDSLADAHTALAMVLLEYDWDWPAAEKEFRRAIEINPRDADAHQAFSYYLVSRGKFDEALAQVRRAQELDPVSLVKITALGQVLLVARRYDEAIEQCKTAIEMDPNLGFAHWLLGTAYMHKGMYEPAIAALQKSIPLSGDSPDEPATLALAYAHAGKIDEARKILADLTKRSERKYLASTVIAVLYAALGQKDQAFALLEKAYNERDFILILLKVEPMFDPLRSDPRFASLVQRVGVPE